MAQKSGGSNENLLAALGALIPIVGIILLIVKGDSKHIKFYSIQSIGVMIATIVVDAVLFVTIIGALLTPIVALVALIAYIYTAIKAYNGEHYLLPYIGAYVDKSFMK